MILAVEYIYLPSFGMIFRAVVLLTSRGVDRNIPRSKSLIREAADKGNGTSVITLADRTCKCANASAPTDAAANAVVGLERASNLEYPCGLLRIRLCLIESYGVKVDLQQRVPLVNRAGNLGDGLAVIAKAR